MELEVAEKCNSGRRKARVNRLSDEKGYRFSRGTRTDFSSMGENSSSITFRITIEKIQESGEWKFYKAEK